MPEYNCVNIGAEGYPVWLTLSDKAVIAAIEPTSYAENVWYGTICYPMVTTVTLIVDGCCVEVKTPLPVDGVCRILGFVWDERDVAAEPEKTEGGGPS